MPATPTTVFAVRKPWIKPRVDMLSIGEAQAGLVAINPEGDAKGS